MDPLVVSITALVIGLASIALTLWRTRRSYNDSDVEELADEVGRLARRARADTMRRVRAEKSGAAQDGEIAVDAPPQLRGALPSQTPQDARAVKQALRVKLLSPDWRH